MITFTIALLLLIGGYVVYGAYVNRVFGPDDRKTQARQRYDPARFRHVSYQALLRRSSPQKRSLHLPPP